MLETKVIRTNAGEAIATATAHQLANYFDKNFKSLGLRFRVEEVKEKKSTHHNVICISNFELIPQTEGFLVGYAVHCIEIAQKLTDLEIS